MIFPRGQALGWKKTLILSFLNLRKNTFSNRFVRVKVVWVDTIPLSFYLSVEFFHIINCLPFWDHIFSYLSIILKEHEDKTLLFINNILDMILLQIILSLLIFTSQAAVVVNQITGITSNNLMYTGTIAVNNEKLFFTFYGRDGDLNPDTLSKNILLVALGSPGRSAQYINVAGIGPKNLNTHLTLQNNPNSVTAFANVVFIDLLGSGYSFASSLDAIPKTSKDYGIMVTKALNSFNTQTTIGKSKTIYIIGQGTFLRILPGLDDIDALQGMIHISGWFDLYGTGKFYGTGGVQLKIFTDSERITIDSTFVNCYNFQRSGKFLQSHSCYDSTLNYIESKTKNRNLYNIQLFSNLTDFVPLVQYYFSQSATVSAIKAPNSALFDTQSGQIQINLYEDLARNIDTNISQYLKDYLSVRHTFITGDDDFVVYRKGTRNWLQSSISFVQSPKFKPLNLTEYTIDGKVVGYRKGVTQITYYQLLNSGHFAYKDKPEVIQKIVKQFIGLGGNLQRQDSIAQVIE